MRHFMRAVNEEFKIAQQVTGYELKEYQQQAIEAYLCRKDVFISALTGADKSLTFELAPFALHYIRDGFTFLTTVLFLSAQFPQMMFVVNSAIPTAVQQGFPGLSKLRFFTHLGRSVFVYKILSQEKLKLA